MGAASEGFIGVLLVILLGIVGIFFYLFTREQQKALQQQHDNEKRRQ